jgi:hypothetical protein
MQKLYIKRIPIDRYYFLIFYLSSGTITFFLLLIKRVLIADNCNSEVSIILLFLFFVYLFYTSWFLFGEESIIINDTNLIYTKKLFWIKKSKSIINKDIKDIVSTDDDFSDRVMINYAKKGGRMVRAFPFWIRMGRIRIVYKNKSFTCLNGLEDQLVHSTIEEMKTILKIDSNR